MKTIAIFFLLAFPTFAQFSQSSVPPRTAAATVNYYVATTGNNSNFCTVSAKCLTLAHALAIVPRLLDANYIINVADGTYAEAIDLSGFAGNGTTGAYAGSLTILGNTGTPANVIFTGTVTCGALATVACLTGPANVTLSGVKLNATANSNLWCQVCNATLSNVTITGTSTYGAVVERGFVVLSNAIAISGFSSSFGTGMYVANGAAVNQISGTVTITGPGGGSTTALGLVEEFGSTYSQASGGTTMNLTITGVQYGILLSSESTFNNFDTGAGTVSITNASTPSGSLGISSTGNSSFQLGGVAGAMTIPSLTIDHFTTCISATTNALVAQGPSSAGPRSLTNCTPSASSNGGTVLLF